MNEPEAREKIERLISASLDGQLSGEEREALAGRLASDPELAAEAERWRRLDALIRSGERVVVDAGAFLAEHRRRRATAARSGWGRHLRWFIPTAAAAAILIAVGIWPTEIGPDGTIAPGPSASPVINVHYARAARPVGAGAGLLEVRFARRADLEEVPPTDTEDQKPKAQTMFAVVSAGGPWPDAPATGDPPPI